MEGYDEVLPRHREDFLSDYFSRARASAETETALYEMAEDTYQMVDPVTTAAGPEAGGKAAMLTDETFAEQQ